MKTARHYPKFTALVAVLSIALVTTLTRSKAMSDALIPLAAVDPDISAEAQILDAFSDDLARFDKKCAAQEKKASVARSEFDLLQRDAGDLKIRVSQVQTALRSMIQKFKAAGKWDSLDTDLLARVTDARTKEIFTSRSFKRELEAAASQLNQNEIPEPLDKLRSKLVSELQGPHYRSDRVFSWRATPVVYTAPVKRNDTLRCKLGSLRRGISGFIFQSPTRPASLAELCNCYNADEWSDLGVPNGACN